MRSEGISEWVGGVLRLRRGEPIAAAGVCFLESLGELNLGGLSEAGEGEVEKAGAGEVNCAGAAEEGY